MLLIESAHKTNLHGLDQAGHGYLHCTEPKKNKYNDHDLLLLYNITTAVYYYYIAVFSFICACNYQDKSNNVASAISRSTLINILITLKSFHCLC